VVLESCHSYIHDLLKQLGPTNAMDPAIQQEINNFPPEAKVSPDFIKLGLLSVFRIRIQIHWVRSTPDHGGFCDQKKNYSCKKLQFTYP
jgi:hypothetical protein